MAARHSTAILLLLSVSITLPAQTEGQLLSVRVIDQATGLPRPGVPVHRIPRAALALDSTSSGWVVPVHQRVQRLRMAMEVTSRVWHMAHLAIQRQHPELTEQQRMLHFIGLHYGGDLAIRVREWLEARDRAA